MAMQFLDASEVAEALSVSRSTAYRIIQKLNNELSERGYLIVAGKISRKYFAERLYGGEELMKPQVCQTTKQREM